MDINVNIKCLWSDVAFISFFFSIMFDHQLCDQTNQESARIMRLHAKHPLLQIMLRDYPHSYLTSPIKSIMKALRKYGIAILGINTGRPLMSVLFLVIPMLANIVWFIVIFRKVFEVWCALGLNHFSAKSIDNALAWKSTHIDYICSLDLEITTPNKTSMGLINADDYNIWARLSLWYFLQCMKKMHKFAQSTGVSKCSHSQLAQFQLQNCNGCSLLIFLTMRPNYSAAFNLLFMYIYVWWYRVLCGQRHMRA